jgi:hypothetical protein
MSLEFLLMKTNKFLNSIFFLCVHVLLMTSVEEVLLNL